MSSELEHRLRRALAALPGPSSAVERRAREAALAALPPFRERRASRRLLVIVLAAAGVLAAAAAALAAIGTIEVRLGRGEGGAENRRAAPSRLLLPAHSDGLALVTGGKLSLVIRGGFRIEGLHVSAAAISPRARYVAAGLRSSLVVLAADGRHVWMKRTRGRVVAVAWARSGLEIAYVVRVPHRASELHRIEGDGDHERLVDAGVAPVTPSWRADSLALAYVSAGGRVVVDDARAGSRRVLSRSPCGGGAARVVAFAARGGLLAYVTRASVVIARPRTYRTRCARSFEQRSFTGVAWTGAREFATVELAGTMTWYRTTEGGRVVDTLRANARTPLAAVAAPARGGVAIVAARGRDHRVRVLAVDVPRRGGRALHTRRVLLEQSSASGPTALVVR